VDADLVAGVVSAAEVVAGNLRGSGRFVEVARPVGVTRFFAVSAIASRVRGVTVVIFTAEA